MDTSQTLLYKEPGVHQWDALIPATAPQYDDPYAHLSLPQVNQLALLARICWLVNTGRDTPDSLSAQEAQRIRQAFAETGLDADWLLGPWFGLNLLFDGIGVVMLCSMSLINESKPPALLGDSSSLTVPGM